MALPPIITDAPLFKALSGKSEPVQPRPTEKDVKVPVKPATDKVELSSAALDKLAEAKTENDARETAQKIRTQLEADPYQELGLGSSFA